MRLPISHVPGHFNPRSLAGATAAGCIQGLIYHYFNPRSLAGATRSRQLYTGVMGISIHAPSRERQSQTNFPCRILKFQSTLPRGSDAYTIPFVVDEQTISIHAPSRERPSSASWRAGAKRFQSTLPRGSDKGDYDSVRIIGISIHAPSRERHPSVLPTPRDLQISIHAPSRERR